MSIKTRIFVATSCAFFISFQADAIPLHVQAVNKITPIKMTGYVGGGLRYDSLDWNIASDLEGVTTPNILSELKWSDMTFMQIKAGGELDWGPWYAEGAVAMGFVTNGRNQDSDYLGDGRTLEFSRSNNKIEGSKTYDYSLAVGYKQQFTKNKSIYTLTPLVGYSHNILDLRMTDGFQTIPATGSFNGLNSSYKAEFEGPWLGVNFSTEPSDRSKLNLRYEYHWYDYYAAANWNLRTNLAHPTSFEHFTEGTGGVLKGEYRYNISPLDELSFSYEQRNWKSDAGIDRIHIVSPSPLTVDTKLNEINWESQHFMMNYKKRF